MIFTYQPGAPPLPFPTAFPGSGITLSNPVSGSHATNPTNSRFNTIHLRTIRPPAPQRRHIYYNPTTYTYVGFWPQAFLDQLPFDIFMQKWLTYFWKTNLTAGDRSAWQTLAATTPLQNMYGTTRHFSGFGFYLHVNRMAPASPYLGVYPWSPDLPPYWATAPATWPTLTAVTFSILKIIIGPPWPTPFVYPYPTLEVQSPGTRPKQRPWVAFWLSYPGIILSAYRQGALCFQGGFFTDYAPHQLVDTPCVPSRPPLRPGQTITLVTRTIDIRNGGESPATFHTLTAIAPPI